MSKYLVCHVRAYVTSVFALLCVPSCLIGLAPAGHCVADTCASARVHVLHHDEGMLLQRGHSQVAVIGHLLQKAAVSRPNRVANLKDPSGESSDLKREGERQKPQRDPAQVFESHPRPDLHINPFSLSLSCLSQLHRMNAFSILFKNGN